MLRMGVSSYRNIYESVFGLFTGIFLPICFSYTVFLRTVRGL